MGSKILFLILRASLPILLCGCVTTTIPESAKAKIHRLALVCLFPPQIDIHQMGVFPVLHESQLTQIDEWDTYRFTADLAEKILSEQGYEVINIDTKNDLLPLPELPDPLASATRYKALASSAGADAIVVVAPYRMTSNGPTFYSVYFSPSKLFGVKSVWGGCASSVHIFQTNSPEVLAQSKDSKSFQAMPGVTWRESWAEYSKEERVLIYRNLEKIIEMELRRKFDKLL